MGGCGSTCQTRESETKQRNCKYDTCIGKIKLKSTESTTVLFVFVLSGKNECAVGHFPKKRGYWRLNYKITKYSSKLFVQKKLSVKTHTTPDCILMVKI